MKKVLVVLLMLIIISFSFIGYTKMDTDANHSIPQETKEY